MDIYFEVLGRETDLQWRALRAGVILTKYSLEAIQKKIDEHSQGWNGDIGKGCQIMARILTQI